MIFEGDVIQAHPRDGDQSPLAPVQGRQKCRLYWPPVQSQLTGFLPNHLVDGRLLSYAD